MDNLLHYQLLYDFYGELLTKRQNEVMSLYYEADLGLAEIAQLLKTSRQAVFNHLKAAQSSLDSYESKLGFMRDYCKNQKRLGSTIRQLERILKGNGLNNAARDGIEEVKTILEGMSNLN